MTIAFISHPDCYKHEIGTHHPERRARLPAIADRLLASGLDALLRHYELPEEMMALAKEKVQEINTAHDQIRDARRRLH